MRKIQPKSAPRVCSAPILRGSLGEKRRSDLSVLCVCNSESYCVWISRYFICLATGELFKLDGLFLPVSVSQIVDYCPLCEIVEWIVFQALYAAARLAVGSADRLLAVFFPQCRDSTLPSFANPEIS